MELTLTGASLTSDSPLMAGNGKAAKSCNNNNSLDKKCCDNHNSNHGGTSSVSHGQSHTHTHTHTHTHGKKQCDRKHGQTSGKKKCCDHDQPCSASNVSSKFQTVESIPIPQLLSNPTLLLSALITSLKGGTFETFEYLVKIILDQETKEKNSDTYVHGVDGIQIVSNDGLAKQQQQLQLQQKKSVFAVWSKDEHNGSSTQSQSALTKVYKDGHTLFHWAAKRSDDIRFLKHLCDLPDLKNGHCSNSKESKGGKVSGSGSGSRSSSSPISILHTKSDDAVGMTPLHWACTEGSIQIVNYILKFLEENVHAASTSYNINQTFTQQSMVKGVDGHGHGQGQGQRSNVNSPLTLEIEPSSSKIDMNEISKPHPIDTRDKSGCTPLLISAQYGHANLCAFLIQRGADPYSVDHSGDTALHWAAYKGSVEVCGLLLHMNMNRNSNGDGDEHGDESGKEGGDGNKKSNKQKQNRKGCLDLQDSFGQTPLHLASLRGNVEVVEYILDQAEMLEEMRDPNENDDIGAPGAGTESGVDDDDLELGGGDLRPNSLHGLLHTPPNNSKSIPAQLLTMTDKDSKTALDLSIKKKKPHVTSFLSQAMDQHCTSHLSKWEKCTKVIKQFASPKNWWSWLGMESEGNRPPKFIFWFVAINMALAFSYDVIVYVGASGSSAWHGRLDEYKVLHYCTMFGFVFTWLTFILVHRTDPGTLANKNYASSNLPSTRGRNGNDANINLAMDGCMDATRTCSTGSCASRLDENKKIKREMHTLTNDLRNLYKSTLESYAIMDHDSASNESKSKKEELTLCHSCHIARPHRSKHCRVLNRCVLLFDHHCPFVGTTIGLYNYKYFYTFVISFTITEILFGISGFLYLRNAPKETGLELGKVCLVIYFALYTVMTFGLSVYHTKLVQRNLTTNEHQNMFRYKYLKDENGRYKNPFHRGCLKNFRSRCVPGKDAYTLEPEDGGGGSGVENNVMDVELRSINTAMTSTDKKNEERLSLVQNSV